MSGDLFVFIPIRDLNTNKHAGHHDDKVDCDSGPILDCPVVCDPSEKHKSVRIEPVSNLRWHLLLAVS